MKSIFIRGMIVLGIGVGIYFGPTAYNKYIELKNGIYLNGHMTTISKRAMLYYNNGLLNKARIKTFSGFELPAQYKEFGENKVKFTMTIIRENPNSLVADTLTLTGHYRYNESDSTDVFIREYILPKNGFWNIEQPKIDLQ